MDRLKLMVVGLVALLAAPLAWGQDPVPPAPASTDYAGCVERQFVEISAPYIKRQSDGFWVARPDRVLNEREIVYVSRFSLTRDEQPILGFLVMGRSAIYWTEQPPQLGHLCTRQAPAPPAAAALTADQRDRVEARRFQILQALDALPPSDLW